MLRYVGRCAICWEDDLSFWVAPEQQSDGTWITDVVPPKEFRRRDFPLTKRVAVPLEEAVKGDILPPSDPIQYKGVWKGVQGDQNSCYMDASIFAMFSYATVFDDILLHPSLSDGAGSADAVSEVRAQVCQVLRENIVNRLRK